MGGGGAKEFDFDVRASVQKDFIVKVYGLLSIQMLITTGLSVYCMFHKPATEWVLNNADALLTSSMILTFVCLFSLFCFAKKHPINLILLFMFTLCESATIATICAAYQKAGYGDIVLEAFLLTTAIFLSLTFVGLTVKADFSWMSMYLSSGLMILIFWGFIAIFFPMGPIAMQIYSLL